MRYLSSIRLLVLLVNFVAIPALALELAPKKKNVSVVDSHMPNAKVIGSLSENEKVKSDGRQGMYWSINWNGKKGFVRVTEMKPVSSSSNVTKALKYNASKAEESKSNRTRATAVMGIRGLDDGEDITSGGKPNEELTRKMEERVVRDGSVAEIERSVNAELEKKLDAAPAK